MGSKGPWKRPRATPASSNLAVVGEGVEAFLERTRLARDEAEGFGTNHLDRA